MKKLIQTAIIITSVSAMLNLTGCSTSDMHNMVDGGESIATSSVKHASISPSHVKLYYSDLSVSKHMEILGRVSANNDNLMGIPHSQETISEELKKRAALLGANGVIHIKTGFEQTTGDAVMIH